MVSHYKRVKQTNLVQVVFIALATTILVYVYTAQPRAQPRAQPPLQLEETERNNRKEAIISALKKNADSNLATIELARSGIESIDWIEDKDQVHLHHCKTTATGSFSRLSRSTTMLTQLDTLYAKYGEELASLHTTMKKWCDQVQSCKFCDREAEMLYMQIREWTPNRVFEMAPNRGYSTHFILSALKANGIGHLDSYDIHDAANRSLVDSSLRSYWNFTLGDVTSLIVDNPNMMKVYDFIFIDALHTNDFSRWYTQDLLSHSVSCNTPVVIHDIVANAKFEGRESQPVYAYLGFQQDIGPVFNLNTDAGVPTPYDKVKQSDSYTEYENIRSKHGVSGDQKDFKCSGRDPSIFFLKMEN